MLTKKIITFGILVIVLAGVLAPNIVFGQDVGSIATMVAGMNGLAGQSAKGAIGSAISDIFAPVFKGIGWFFMTVSSLILILCGWLFDYIVDFSIVKMATNIGDPNGVGGAITLAWATLRDIANMFFIFVLLFVAFKNMFDTNFGKFRETVRDIIIIALLINFSLFFTKVVIDASNVVSLGFYNSITNSSNNYKLTGSVFSGSNEFTISGGYMKMLGLQSWYSADILSAPEVADDAIKLLVLGFTSSVFMLVTAVVLLIAAIMFISRFVLLVLLMILSPLAFIAYIIPGQQKHFNDWKESLISQAFFAPVYFALTWVVFRLGTAIIKTTNAAQAQQGASAVPWTKVVTEPKSAMALILNYVLIIGFSVAALIISKKMATTGATGTAFKTVTAGIGGAVTGTAAFAGRQTFGRTGKYFADNATLQDAAKNRKGLVGAAARSGLYLSKAARSGTFDVRNASVPTSVVGDLVEGTVGRTGVGKKLGLNDVNIPNVDVGSRIIGDDLGKPETKGYKELKEESNKRVRDREAAAASELSIAQAKKDVINGSKDTANPAEIDAMEKALSKLSDKETETLVASNRDLLNSLNFANAISVKQLEVLNKSDQFSDDEKGRLKNIRFREIAAINDPTGLAALAVPVAARTPTQIADAARIEKARNKVKGLADSELEMINPNYLDPTRSEGREFIEQLKGNQVDSINKSSKFSTTQKEAVKKERMRPLMDALARGRVADVQNMVRKADIKTKISYLKTDGRGTPPIKIGVDPAVLPTYTPKTLQRMATHDEMTDSDISTLRAAILGAGLLPTHPTVVWLNDPNKGMIDFPP